MKRVIILLLAVMCTFSSYAQSEYEKLSIATSVQDVAVSVGPYMSFHNEDLNNGINLNVDYGHFFGDLGFGVRGGLNYVHTLEEGIYLLGMPLNCAWRMPLGEGTSIKVKGGGDNDIRYHRFNFEATLGVTPSIIMGSGYETTSFDSAIGFPYTTDMIITNRFCITGDVGCKISMRLGGQYSLFVQPQYHYRFTNNYSKTTYFGYSESMSETYIPTRSYFSANIGVSLTL